MADFHLIFSPTSGRPKFAKKSRDIKMNQNPNLQVKKSAKKYE